MNNNECLNKTIAAEIKRLDKEIVKLTQKAEQNIKAAQERAILIGQYMEEIKKSQRPKWVEEHCQVGWVKIKNYLAIANTAKKRASAIDHRFFKLIGLLKNKTIQRKKNNSSPKWLVWTSKLNAFAEDVRQAYDKGEVSQEELATVTAQFKPIARLYNQQGNDK